MVSAGWVCVALLLRRLQRPQLLDIPMIFYCHLRIYFFLPKNVCVANI